MRTRIKLTLSLGLLPALALAQLADPKTFVTTKTSASLEKITPGAQFDLTVTVEIKKTIHLQAHKPAEDYLIPTVLTLEQADGLTFGEGKYPEPKSVKLSFSDKPLLAYEDKLLVTVPVTVAADAQPGARELHGTLRYQGCDDKQCYAPANVQIKIPLTIAAPEKPKAEAPPPEIKSAPSVAAPAASADTVRLEPHPPTETQKSKINWLPLLPGVLEQAKRDGKPVIMDFWAEWCIPCKEMEATTFADPRVIESSKQFVMVKVDTTNEADPQTIAVAMKFNIRGVPTTILFDAQGKQTLYESGYIGAAEFLQQMHATLENKPQAEKSGLAGRFESALGSGRLWLALFLCFVGGLALNLTPCVLPMIGITVSYFGGQTRRDTREAFGYALAYFFGVVATYSTLGLVAASTGALFGSLLQRPIVLILIATVLVALALAMFGLYEFQPPQFLLQRATGLSSKAGHVGVFFLGAVMGVVAAPCIGPFIVALLVVVGQRGDLWLGWWLFFAFSVGLALPYLILGTYSSLLSKLPKSGAWMVKVKYVFGVVLLALAVWFLRPLLRPLLHF